MRIAVLCLLMLASPVLAQDRTQTLADIKAELSALMAEFTALKQELVTTGAATSGAAGGDALQRLDAIESELVRLTAKTEAVQLKLSQVVADGTNRIGDIEFRLCELTEGCDPAALPATPELGGSADAAPATDAPVTPAPDATAAGPDMAVNEQSDFDRAQGVLDSGDFRTAADLFTTYAATYPGGALAQKAGVRRGDGCAGGGDVAVGGGRCCRHALPG